MFSFNNKFDCDKKFYSPYFYKNVDINRVEKSLSVIDEEQESSVLEVEPVALSYNFAAFMDQF